MLAGSSGATVDGATPDIPVPNARSVRHCDVIMKGGITSGVVYPAAGVELAKQYILKNIGGASAGAIAAALFAAAEYRRQVQKTDEGFAELQALPATFGSTTPSGTSYLLALFQPAKDARGLFRLLLAFLGNDRWRKAFRVLGTAAIHYPLAFILGFLPGVALALLAFLQYQNWPARACFLLLGLATLLLGLLVPTLAIALDLARATSKHQFGICPGRADSGASATDPPPLTDWIEANLDRTAFGSAPRQKRPEGYAAEDPLTFADLWGARTEAECRKLEADGTGRLINLEVMTTNLTQGRPYRLPFESHDLYFDPKDLERLFSSRILAFMNRRRRQPSGVRDQALMAKAAALGLVPLPNPADVPVAVAVRMSLSFPILISAVPLWGFDFSYAAKDADGTPGDPRPTKCWFSDGGITSNFPIHFFDGLLPRWPTFAFNLTPFHPRFAYRRDDETKNVWLPRTNGDGQTENWSNPPEGGAFSQLFWFLGLIVDTMHNWHDNIQLKVPGYRDRIAQIHLRDEEGGLNLTMPPEFITALSSRGAYAAKVLAERFSDAPRHGTILTWDNHCWVRLRSTMSLLEKQLAKIQKGLSSREGIGPYATLESKPPSYHFENAAAAHEMLAAFTGLCEAWARYSGELSKNAPKPSPELRITPRV